MKYKSTGTRAGHKLFVRKRETPFDKNQSFNSTFGTFEDHKEMKTYEYAAFQKKVFKEKALQKRKKKLLILITSIIVLLIILAAPSIFKFILSSDYLNVN
ncbi:hypothetical protein [Ulvibacter litoralis]|uniref:Uncharacterized protein n=1 Tax=Ulvibacter litoralis TaxID=227084 RepID=A0A1G7F304_9FLAO|nr:hypothetical protein [Ulvibacter litoralis]GHC52912.1 hypothetical protein GCM10008083_16080 [Ulvibacter litoralis]SDE70126.1 hypothetical protein SAMN05421855_102291 [Ulvibacter litoralis]